VVGNGLDPEWEDGRMVGLIRDLAEKHSPAMIAHTLAYSQMSRTRLNGAQYAYGLPTVDVPLVSLHDEDGVDNLRTQLSTPTFFTVLPEVRGRDATDGQLSTSSTVPLNAEQLMFNVAPDSFELLRALAGVPLLTVGIAQEIVNTHLGNPSDEQSLLRGQRAVDEAFQAGVMSLVDVGPTASTSNDLLFDLDPILRKELLGSYTREESKRGLRFAGQMFQGHPDLGKSEFQNRYGENLKTIVDGLEPADRDDYGTPAPQLLKGSVSD
jgi:hypothetical protein